MARSTMSWRHTSRRCALRPANGRSVLKPPRVVTRKASELLSCVRRILPGDRELAHSPAASERVVVDSCGRFAGVSDHSIRRALSGRSNVRLQKRTSGGQEKPGTRPGLSVSRGQVFNLGVKFPTCNQLSSHAGLVCLSTSRQLSDCRRDARFRPKGGRPALGVNAFSFETLQIGRFKSNLAARPGRHAAICGPWHGR